MTTADQPRLSVVAVAAILAGAAVCFFVFLWSFGLVDLPDLPDLSALPPWAWAAVAGWLALAGLTAWLAKERGRSGRLWFVAGAIFGPFALLAVGLAPVRASGR